MSSHLDQKTLITRGSDYIAKILPAWVANQNTEFALSSLATESAIYLTCNKKCSSKKRNKKYIYQGGTPDFK